MTTAAGGARMAPGGISLWKWAIGPWMIAVIIAAFVWVGPAANFMRRDAARIIFFHVPEALLLAVWFLVAAYYSVRLLRTGNLQFDMRASAAAEVGLLCTVLATVSGAVFAKVQWGTYWNWDPKQVAIVIVLFIYMAYFALRSEVEDRNRAARLCAAYAIVSGVAVPFLIKFLPQLPVFQSLHPPDTLTARGGMSTDYSTVFYASLVGFLGITIWVYNLRLRLSAVTERLAAE